MRVLQLLTLVVALLLPGASAAAESYDVSYFTHESLERLRGYARRVARLLGPELARGLRVIERDDGFRLVYDRNGDRASSTRIARAHSRILRRHGLRPATAVPSRDGRLLGAPSVALLERPAQGRGATAEPAGESRLEARIEQHVKELRRRGLLAPDERTAWSVFDFTTGEKLVAINEDRPMQAASMIKPLFALAFFHRVAQGKLAYGPESRRQMELMIQESSNAAANWVLRQVGGPAAANRILRRSYGELFQDTTIVEKIPPGGRTYRNRASAHDYSRFLHAVWRDEVPYARELRRLMGLPSANRLQADPRDLPPGARIYNKTGSTRKLCGDIGVIEVEGPDGRRHAYTVIGIVEKARGASSYRPWIRARGDVIREVASLIHRAMAARHRPAGPSAAIGR